MKGLKVNREGHNVLGYRIQLAHITGFGGEVAPPTHRFYSGGEQIFADSIRGRFHPTLSFRIRWNSL